MTTNAKGLNEPQKPQRYFSGVENDVREEPSRGTSTRELQDSHAEGRGGTRNLQLRRYVAPSAASRGFTV